MRRNETVMLPINELMDFEAQPFKVLDDDSMYELADSIKEVSFLNVKLQVSLNDQIDFYECKLNTHQATVLKKHYLEGTLTDSVIKQILTEEDKSTSITLNYNKLKKYFPNSYTAKQCEKALWEILDKWHKYRIA